MDDQADANTRAELAEDRDLPRRFGSVIIELRNARGWKQKELARRAGLHPARLSKLEKGAPTVRLLEVVHLARALDADLDSLVLGFRAHTGRSHSLDLVRAIEDVASPAEAEALGRLLQLLLLGYQRAAGTRS